jgi:hypothetical protein
VNELERYELADFVVNQQHGVAAAMHKHSLEADEIHQILYEEGYDQCMDCGDWFEQDELADDVCDDCYNWDENEEWEEDQC